MTPLHRIEERLHALTFRQAIGLVAGANLFLVALALALPADGEMRGPAVLSILGNFHILALHIPAAVLLVVRYRVQLRVRADLTQALDTSIVTFDRLQQQREEADPAKRVDLIVDADGTPWFLEVNVAPGMTETSTFPQAVAAAGLDLGELVSGLVGRAVEG
mgnify:CR=1 FL=1